jgi:multimeric flavodoxin WrbA
MKCLIINTLPQNDDKSTKIIDTLSAKANDTEVLDTNKYKIGSCMGCYNYWFKTPGVCALKDDWELMFKKFLKSEYVIFITETRFGFVSSKMKNIVDRLIPLGLPHSELHNGELRHAMRYKKCWKIGIVYSGNGDKNFLNEWLERFALNFFSTSLGVYNIDKSEELYHEIGNI